MTRLEDARKQFFELSLELCCISDFNGNFLALNSAWTEVLGWSTEELLAKPYIEFVHPEDRERTAQATALAKGDRFSGFENRYVTKDGSYRWLQWSGKIDIPNGLFYGMARDITEARINALRQAELEKQLTASEALFQQMAANVPGMLYRFALRTDGWMGFVYASRGCREIFGVTPEELQSEFPRLLADMHPDDLVSWQASVGRSAKELSLWQWEGRISTPLGEKWIRGSSMPRQLPNGDVEWDGFLTDITAEKRSQELIEQQRTRLIHSSKMASLGEMAGNVAHEINNPLAVMMGKAWQLKSMAERGPVPQEKVSEFAGRIESMGDRIAKIVRGLRFFARNGEGDAFEYKGMHSIVEDTLEFCRTRFQNHGVELRVGPIPSALQIECRSVQISQVLLNLLNNAFDAVLERDPRWIEINCVDADHSIEISVTDCGTGIPEDVTARMMTPFFTTKGVGQGTGLGLSLAKGIVESHHGRLHFDGRSANTRFVVTLPKRQPSAFGS